jgi:hypothetical protein
MNEIARVNSKKTTAKKGGFAPKVKKSDLSSTKSSPVDKILNLQQTSGNQSVQSLFKSGVLQPKLKIGQPGDKYELEADRIAEQVMRMPDSVCPSCLEKEEDIVNREVIRRGSLPSEESSFVQRQVGEEEKKKEEEVIQPKRLSNSIEPVVQRQFEEEEEEEILQTKGESSSTAEVTSDIESGINSLKTSGQPLSESLRNYFEPRFGYDFGRVRVHTAVDASETAKSINARAFTLGNNVVFSASNYSPETGEGKKLLAHELTHVVQNNSSYRYLRRKPDTPEPPSSKTETKTPVREDKLKWVWKDLAVYPLFVDIWRDLTKKPFTAEEKKKFSLKGTESAAIYPWGFAIWLPFLGLGEKYEDDFSKGLETYMKYVEALESLTPCKDVYLDPFSRIMGLRLDEYLGSDLFKLRLKNHTAAVLMLSLVAQGSYSLYQGLKEPSAEIGEFEKTDWSKHLGLVTWLTGKIFKEELKAPDFFDIGPLQMKTHLAFSAKPFAGESPPSGLTLEGSKGFGEGGEETKFSMMLNLPKFIMPHLEGGPSKEDIGDLEKYRKWQTSLWFTYDKFDPTSTMLEAGRLAAEKFKGGAIFGYRGHLGLLESGVQYGGREANDLSMWFLKGGYGYSWEKGSFIKKVGFTATYTDWKESYILAPGIGEGITGPGRAVEITPFFKFGFDIAKKHKLDIGAALSFVMGTEEPFNISGFRSDISYTYLGDVAPEGLPVFKLDLSGSLHRLDWWNPNSPLLWGIQAKASYKRIFTGVQVMGGAEEIPEYRARMMGDLLKVQIPTSMLIVGGYMF